MKDKKKSRSTIHKQKSCVKSAKTFALHSTAVSDNLPKMRTLLIHILMGTIFLNGSLTLEYFGVCRKIVKTEFLYMPHPVSSPVNILL